MKNRIKSNKAITLIALIITIIVLLILAGVSLNLVLGDNGIFKKANWTTFTTEYSQIQEGTDLYNMDKELKEESEELTNKDCYPINEKTKQLTDISDLTLINTILEIENITDISEAELYKIDLKKIDYDGKNDYIVNVKSGRVYRYKGFKYESKKYHVPELAVGETDEPYVGNLTVNEDYQFWKTSGAKVDVSFDVLLPEVLEGAEIRVENPDSTNAKFEGTYSNGHYAGTIITNENNNPNGTYTYKIIATKGDKEYEKQKIAKVSKFLDDPQITIENVQADSFTIKVTNKYPEEAGITYKYTCNGNTYSEKGTTKDITGLNSNTEYNIQVEAILPNNTSRTSTKYQTTKSMVAEIDSIEDLERINDKLYGKYILTRDLDFDDYGSYETEEKYYYYTETDEDGNKINSWTPINEFHGTFNGNNYTIRNLYINRWRY